MTSAQINYRQHIENVRHNQAQEENWQKSLDETVRHNQRQEELSRYSSDISAAASKYVGETRAGATMYSADKTADTAQKRLDFDQLKFKFEKYVQNYQNELAAFRYKLDRDLNDSKIQVNSAQIDKWAKDVENTVEDLRIKAEQLGINELSAEFENALRRARTWEAYSKTAMNSQQVIRTIINDVDNVFNKSISNKVSNVLRKFGIEQPSTPTQNRDFPPVGYGFD